ncbi:DUF3558 domain-containing protein [Crossiella sp. SN42]|uniref:DUF3558 domain-containing protein n=1 Tax=Crossiella sp. SN42 TaxID=2944808 RepID=UPI00207D0FFE|nr:DUF3558 family protein [Crossiella sp. SN42]MCO1575525.1 DUF3558 domain-containing protein [Crossiella sp. SN42]
MLGLVVDHRVLIAGSRAILPPPFLREPFPLQDNKNHSTEGLCSMPPLPPSTPGLLRGLWHITTGACVALALAGCALTPPHPGNPHGAPPWNQPELNIEPFKSGPDLCRLLTDPQLDELGITVPGKYENDIRFGPLCRWDASETPARINFTLAVTIEAGGIDNVYRRKNQVYSWMPLEISGYPAATYSDTQVSGWCKVSVGVRKDAWITLGAYVPGGITPGTDHLTPCLRGPWITERVMTTVKGQR